MNLDLYMDTGERVVAVIFDKDGSVYDLALNWQTAQNYALGSGRRVVAIADDGYMSVAEAQKLYDSERARILNYLGRSSL